MLLSMWVTPLIYLKTKLKPSTSSQNNPWNKSQIDALCITEGQRVETSPGPMMNHCGEHKGISTHQPSHTAEPVIAFSSAVVFGFDVLGAVAAENLSAASHNKKLMWGHLGLGGATALSVFGLIKPEECVFGWTVDCCFRLWLHSTTRFKMLKQGIPKPHPHSLMDHWTRCRWL